LSNISGGTAVDRRQPLRRVAERHRTRARRLPAVAVSWT
jgi:hypothetical protein